MIRALVEQTFDSTKKYLVMFGLSTDTKPTAGLITGSEFHEVDTGVKYEFDEVGTVWHDVGITEQEIKDEIDAWLDAHPEATTTVEDGAISYAKLNSSLQGTVDDVADLMTEIQNKANVDGSYSSLTAGNAEQLVSTVGVNDKTPYLFRTTGGSADVGDRVKLSEITGGTVAWNQLAFELSSNNWSNSDSVSYSDGIATAHKDSSTGGTLSINLATGRKANVYAGHKYLFIATVQTVNGQLNLIPDGTSSHGSLGYATYTSKTTIKYLWNCGTNDLLYFLLRGYTGSGVTSAIDFTVENPMCSDLTAMFGSTIADYLYTLESGTPGAGVAKLKSWGFCTKPYYAYDAGSLLSVKTSAHKTIGFNAYDNATGKAKVVGGQVYQITGTYTALSLDGTSITPDASGYFTPAASGEITVTGGNATDTCIHLKWDGERDGEWEEYSEYSYPIDDVELRGIPKLDASNNLYYDGDGYAPDGTVTRKYGIVDLGTLEWTERETGSVNTVYSATLPYAYLGYSTNAKMSGKWLSVPQYNGATTATQLITNVDSSSVGVFSFSNAGASTSTVYLVLPKNTPTTSASNLVYELDTPTTESADPFQETQICDDFGTEEFVDSRTVPMPVGYNAFYQANLRAKLEMAPDSPNGDGDYIVRQTDGLNEYVLLEKELPSTPSEDGTYSLKCVVADGTATLSWVADA